jgi:mevalonate kinase
MMPAFSATAPGKIILFGEHAVVYGRPAIAVPVTRVSTRVMVSANVSGESGEVHVLSPQVDLDTSLAELSPDHPLKKTVEILLSFLGIPRLPACSIRISSTIPVASGMGSGAAVTVAMLRSLAAFLGHPLNDANISSLAFEVEKIYHGTPSGIDNTVISFHRPVYYVKGEQIQFLKLHRAFILAIANTGIASPTSVTVGDVHRGWLAEPERYENIFDHIATIVKKARVYLEKGEIEPLGDLMNANHTLLKELDVSSTELDRLAEAARQNGALGAKLSGGGRGGNLISLVPAGVESQVAAALERAGARKVIVTTVRGEG